MPAIDPLLEEVLKRGGSDLHIAVGHPPLVRVGGDLVAVRDKPLDANEVDELLDGLLQSPSLQREALLYIQELLESKGAAP